MPDGNANNQDALPHSISSGQASGGRSSDGGQNPSQPQSYTRDQVDKLLNEGHSKLDKTIADLTKERDGLKTSHESLSQRLAEIERRREEEEEARVKDDPDELDLYTRRKKAKETELAHQQRQADLDARENTLKEREARQAERDWAGTVAGVAAAARGDAETLKTKAAALGISETPFC